MGVRLLGGLDDGVSSTALGINNTGQAVGQSFTPDSYGVHAFNTGPNGVGMRDLGTLGGALRYAYSINDSGQVVGLSRLTAAGGVGETYHAFITGPNGAGMRGLGALGGDYSSASGINEAGVVGVYSLFGSNPDALRHAFITGPDGVGMTDLNLLVKVPDDFLLINAVDINNQGQVIAIGVIPEPESYIMLLAGANECVGAGSVFAQRASIGELFVLSAG